MSESNFALESGMEGSTTESEQVLVRLHTRIFVCNKEGDSLEMSLQEQNTDKFTVHAAGGATDGGHERDGVIVII